RPLTARPRGHSGAAVSRLDPDAPIRHIAHEHREELIGMMTLYPFEWPYRDPNVFDRICGRNVALDVDDLVLVTPSTCLVLGTYGRRGGAESSTDWQGVLAQTRAGTRVSWPEFVLRVDAM